MAKIMFLDTECNSLDTKGGFIQELAWAIFDVQSQRLLRSRSYIIMWGMGYMVEPGAFETTDLSREFCEDKGLPARQVFEEFILAVKDVQCVCGHNIIDYDKPMIQSNIKRIGFSTDPLFEERFTIDTMYDLPLSKKFNTRALKYLAFDHGYILSDAHQALADVFACAAIFFKYDFKQIVEVAQTPLVTLSGFTEYMDEPGREAFYQAKFRWNKANRRWERRTRAYYIKEAQLTLGKRFLFCDDKKVTITEEAKPEEPEQQELMMMQPVQEKPEIPF